MTAAARLRMILLGLDPAPWRVIEVPLSMSFKGLHSAIQAAFGWFDIHHWEFDFDGCIYGPATDFGSGGERIYNAANAQLTELRQAKIGSFLYTYNLREDWVHYIDVVELFDAGVEVSLPRFLEGEWRTPTENVRGPPGFEHFLEALKVPANSNLLDWRDGPFDAKDIERDVIDVQFKHLADAPRRKT